MRRCIFQLLAALLLTMRASGQQSQIDLQIDDSSRAIVIERLTAMIERGYVIPEAGQIAIRNLHSAYESGEYKRVGTAKQLAERLTADLRAATNDKHIAIFFDPEVATPPKSSTPPKVTERFNFGFERVERLRGNIGYLDLRSFADLNEGRETASAYLTALANFDAIIIDLRHNGGGNTPMVAYIASYFFDPKPVHLTDMYWRDENRTVQLWTSESLPGRRSVSQDVYLLVGPSTFSAAEDFCYSLQQLKRATLVGERTGGGAHMGRGLQRVSPLFTAFIPVGQSLNPVSKTNWENVGVEPDIKVPVEKALVEAHLAALRKLIVGEGDPAWQENLRRVAADVAAGN